MSKASAHTPFGHEVIARNLTVPESARWREGELWFTDGSTVKVLGRDGGIRTHARVDCNFLIGLSFTEKGEAIVSDAEGRRVMRITQDGGVGLVVDLSNETDFMLNEAMALPDGSIVVDDVGFDLAGHKSPAAARMIHISADGRVKRTGSPMLFANGLALTDDGTALLVAEAFGKRIWRYAVIPGEGLDEGIVLITLSESGLDGVAPASDGNIWYTNIENGHVVLVDRFGVEKRRLYSGFGHATSCALDGTGSRLFVTALGTMPETIVLPNSGRSSLKFNGDGAIVSIRL
jgi:sugar lactone lactonase YvrE